jgi:hypothetical protein
MIGIKKWAITYITDIHITGGDEIQLHSSKKASIENMKLKVNMFCYIIVLQSSTCPKV